MSLTIHHINEIPFTILFNNSNGNKLLKNNGYKYKIIIRFSKPLFDKMFQLFMEYGIEIQQFCKGDRCRNKDDPEKVKEYNFDKVMEYNNTYGFYEICYMFHIFTTSKEHSVILGNYLHQLIEDNVYKPSKITIKKNTDSVSLRSDIMEKVKSTWTGDNGVDIKYKINILSLGRYTDKLGTTHKILTEMKIHHYLFCEEKEFYLYDDWIDKEYCVLMTGPNFSERNEGGQHMRNHIIEYWFNEGEEYIWMLDDNISEYQRLNMGKKIKIKSKEIFTSIEHYISHFDNIGLCSHNIHSYVTGDGNRTCIVINEKHFSSLLINIQTGLRFRFKYNEDHILSIDNLCSGFQTICFNHILYNKPTSGNQKGGNSGIYDSQGTQDGYNKKCFDTIDFIRLQMGIGSMNMKDFNKIFTIQKKPKKGVEISHLQINYQHIESNKNLQQIQEMTEFNSGLVLE